MRRVTILPLLLAVGLSACGPETESVPNPSVATVPSADNSSVSSLATAASPPPGLPGDGAAPTAIATPTSVVAPISPENLARLSVVAWSTIGLHPSLSPDGQLLTLAACDDAGAEYPTCPSNRFTTLQIWDRESAVMLLETPSGHSESITDLAFSPDGTTLASAGKDGWVRLFDVVTGAEVRSMRFTGEDEPRAVGFSPDGGLLVAGENVQQSIRVEPSVQNGILQVWETTTGRPIMQGAGTYEFGFSPDGRLLATRNDAYGDFIYVYDVQLGERVHGLPLPDFDELSDVIFTPDSSAVITGGNRSRGGIWIWDAETGELLHALDDPGAPDTFALSPDGHWLFSAGGSADITRIWDTRTWESVGSIEAQSPHRATAIEITAEGDILALEAGNHVELHAVSGGPSNPPGAAVVCALEALSEARYEEAAGLFDNETLVGTAEVMGMDADDPGAALAAACSREPGCPPPSRFFYQELFLDWSRLGFFFAYVGFDRVDGAAIAAPCIAEEDFYGCGRATWLLYSVSVDDSGTMLVYGLPLPLQLGTPE
jgi:WD40 repeat protein